MYIINHTLFIVNLLILKNVKMVHVIPYEFVLLSVIQYLDKEPMYLVVFLSNYLKYQKLITKL